jgi:hypothetical protein
MSTQKTELVIILDRSGSMATIRNDIEKGFNTYLEDQRNLPGKCEVTLYQFDDNCEKIYQTKPIADVRSVEIHPRGSTALIDAVCRAIKEVGDRLSSTPECDRPGKVIFQILTDGEENASREFSISQMRDMVKHQTEKYSWEFIFLGTNIDAISTGSSYGYSSGKSMSFNSSTEGITSTFSALSIATRSLRAGVDYNFNDADRVAASSSK